MKEEKMDSWSRFALEMAAYVSALVCFLGMLADFNFKHWLTIAVMMLGGVSLIAVIIILEGWWLLGFWVAIFSIMIGCSISTRYQLRRQS